MDGKVAHAAWWWKRGGYPTDHLLSGTSAHLAAVSDFAALHALSGRETELLRQAAQGRSMKETAFGLGISIKTVENYWRRIYLKTGQDTQLAVLALLFRWSCGAGGDSPARHGGGPADTADGRKRRRCPSCGGGS